MHYLFPLTMLKTRGVGKGKAVMCFVSSDPSEDAVSVRPFPISYNNEVKRNL